MGDPEFVGGSKVDSSIKDWGIRMGGCLASIPGNELSKFV